MSCVPPTVSGSKPTQVRKISHINSQICMNAKQATQSYYKTKSTIMNTMSALYSKFKEAHHTVFMKQFANV